jgi:uracil-DNA glycosylase
MNPITTQVPRGWEGVWAESRVELAQIERVVGDSVWYPSANDLYRAFELTPLSAVRVVIFGQDPYHSVSPSGAPTATGLAFSVRPSDPIPPSLRNIFDEVRRSYPQTPISSGDLSGWAKQGVLLLNTSLTVKPGQPNSYVSVWMPLIVRIISAVLKANPRCIFVMWGGEAKKMMEFLSGTNLVLTSSHPSPFSVGYGFKGCGHFARINDLLTANGGAPIAWST